MKEFVLLRLGDNIVETAKYFTVGSTEMTRTLHGVPLCNYATGNQDIVVIYSVQVFAEFVDRPYPYRFGGPEAPPQGMGDLNELGNHFKSFVAWDNSHLVLHEFGCSLTDSSRLVSARTFFSNNPKNSLQADHGIKRVRWHDMAKGREEHDSLGACQRNAVFSSEFADRNHVSRSDGTVKTRNPSIDDSGRRFSRFRKCNFQQVTSSSGSADSRTGKKQPVIEQAGSDEDIEVPSLFDANESGGDLRLNYDENGSIPYQPNVRATGNKNQSVGRYPNDDELPDMENRNSSDSTGHGTEPHFQSGDSEGEGESSSEGDSLSDSSIDEQACAQILTLPRKRPYVYHTRKRRSSQASRDLRKRRRTLAQRIDNPFLRSRLRCCKSYNCFENVDPIYAFKTYKTCMAMCREDFKSFLINIYEPGKRCFVMQGKKVSARYLQKGFGFSNDLQFSVKNTPGTRAGPTALALPRDVRRATKKDYIVNFLRNYADECGDMMPHALYTNLPDAGRKEVYEYLSEDFKKQFPQQTPPVISFFYAVWRSICSGIRTRRNHGFARCETCVFLKAEIAENQKRAAVVQRANDSLRKHLDMVMEERRMHQNRCDRAIRYPRKYTSIVVDGADQTAYGLQHFREKSKSDRGHKLKVKCVGVLEHRTFKKLRLFAMTEEFLTGANHVIEVIHRTLTSRKNEIGRLTEVLYVQFDNCTRENKNRYTLGYLEMLVTLGVFLEVEVSFLPIGHTHVDIDQAFSAVSKTLKRRDAATMTQLLSVMESCYLGKASAARHDRVANFSGLCEETKCLVDTRSLGGFKDLRYFRFTRASGDLQEDGVFKTQCHVRVQSIDEWQPLSLAPTKGFLKSVPDLKRTPHTETFPPDNATEVNLFLESLHNRNRKLTARAKPELEALRNEVYSQRLDSFHWDLATCLELNGDFKSDAQDEDSNSDEDDSDGEDGVQYEEESFVAVRSPQDTRSRFWIAIILQVVDWSSTNKPRWLRVLWYSPKSGARDEFSARYVPSQVYNPRLKRLVPYEEQVEVEAVLLHFESLNSQGYLRANTRSALRQVLGLN